MQWLGLLGWLVFVFMLTMPVPEGMTPPAHRLAAVTALMALLWLTQAIPIGATALLPLGLYPLLAIQPASEVSGNYLDQNVFLFFGGFVVALGIERWGLHRRMALHVVSWLGRSPRQIVYGFMAATGFLSMWISNTASTMLMLPIAIALLGSLTELITHRSDTTPRELEGVKQFGVALLIGIAYSASLGGLTTLVGTPTNVQMLSIWNSRPDLVEQYGRFSMGTWMAAFGPLAILMAIAAGLILTWGMPSLAALSQAGRAFFRERLRELGRPSFAERTMFTVFVLTAVLWITRAPLTIGELTIISGWGPAAKEWLTTYVSPAQSFLASSAPIHDSTVAMGMACLLFFLPSLADSYTSPRGRIMDWDTLHRKMPWEILLLIGGGLAMAKAFQTTGLSAWIGEKIVGESQGLSLITLTLLICLLMTFLTEFTSNVATVSTLAPIMIDAAVRMDLDPRLLLVPATVSASCAFMLPIATPPNAIVFGSGRITMPQMMRSGFLLNLIGVVLVTLFTLFLFRPLAGIQLP